MADARSRVAYGYFSDGVAIDTTCLKDKFEMPLVSFIGANHHGHSMLLGCGLLAGETTESYIWLLRAWLTCMLGHTPQAVITDHCRNLQTAVADVFPRASHCFHMSCIMQRFPENLGGFFEFEAIKEAWSRIVYYFLRPEEFEAAWEETVQHLGIRDHKWIQTLYEDRKRWVPAYVKETFLAGLFPFQQNEIVPSIFEGYLGMPLCFPNQNGLEEIPSEYILTRWRKDVNRSYVLDHSCGGIDTNHPVHRYNGKVYAINPRLFSSKIVYKSVTQLTT
ncbi:hypothetical protein GH714_023372 [Hevea brasiliensis]|uniref:Protein FAR1-RELATED SEQUENCE n=1 Tax=Hevea brasiliensis TaxID=3981 RepID=A0A6A6LIX3_HEVBR|nr:hypothetical protein GH714_023372 [Hevea brasiliensis]